LKINYIPLAIVLFLGLTSCTSLNLNKKRINIPQNNIFFSADRNFQLGSKLLENRKNPEANFYFDQAVNILLDPDIKSPELKNKLNELIEKISDIQKKYLDSINSQNENFEKALIDDVISTPLFKPTRKQIERIKKIENENSPDFSIPITINRNVVSFITAFRTIKRKSIQNALNRSAEFIDDFKKIFKEHNIPTDLAYLPIIESGFRISARSRARAMGIWQFMGSTARLFGLRVDWVVDERKNPYKAAYAAADYLKYLYGIFGDWYLALASYNGGPGKVKRAIRKTGRRDFFKLARTRYLRRETRNYVPAYIASLIIAKSPGKYGFYIEPTEKIFSNSKIVEIISPVKISEISKLLNISVKDLKKMNPELIREFTPFNKKSYLIRIPADSDENILSKLKKLPSKAKYFVGWYRVKKGDSLYSIARKFRTSVKKIKRVNKLRSNLIRPGKRLLIPRGYR